LKREPTGNCHDAKYHRRVRPVCERRSRPRTGCPRSLVAKCGRKSLSILSCGSCRLSVSAQDDNLDGLARLGLFSSTRSTECFDPGGFEASQPCPLRLTITAEQGASARTAESEPQKMWLGKCHRDAETITSMGFLGRCCWTSADGIEC